MIPMIPFVPGAQIGAYADENYMNMIKLHDRLLQSRRKSPPFAALQNTTKEYLSCLDGMIAEDESSSALPQCDAVRLLRQFTKTSSADVAKIYLMVTTLGDIESELLRVIKLSDNKPKARLMCLSTKRLVQQLLNFRTCLTGALCHQLLDANKA